LGAKGEKIRMDNNPTRDSNAPKKVFDEASKKIGKGGISTPKKN